MSGSNYCRFCNDWNFSPLSCFRHEKKCEKNPENIAKKNSITTEEAAKTGTRMINKWTPVIEEGEKLKELKEKREKLLEKLHNLDHQIETITDKISTNAQKALWGKEE